MPDRAIMHIWPNRPHPAKQEAACLALAEERGLIVVALSTSLEACTTILRAGAANIVIAAVEDAQLEAAVTAAGGRLEVARRRSINPVRQVRAGVAGLVQRMANKGMDTGDMADILDMPTGEIRRIKLDLGIGRRPGRQGGRGAR